MGRQHPITVSISLQEEKKAFIPDSVDDGLGQCEAEAESYAPLSTFSDVWTFVQNITIEYTDGYGISNMMASYYHQTTYQEPVASVWTDKGLPSLARGQNCGLDPSGYEDGGKMRDTVDGCIKDFDSQAVHALAFDYPIRRNPLIGARRE